MTRYFAGALAAAALGLGCGAESPSDVSAHSEAVKFVCDQTINPCCCNDGKTYLPQTDPNYFQCTLSCGTCGKKCI